MESKKIKNLVSKKYNDGNISIQHSECKYLSLPFYRSSSNLSISNELERFIKSIEKLIRKSSTYKGYIKYLREEIGLNQCALYPDLGKGDEITLEMHHSLFTLFDCVSITLVKFLKENKPVSSFDIAKEVLEDHIKNLIPVTMVSKMVHNAVHPGANIDPLFIPLESMWGDIIGYIEKYKGCFSPDNIARLRRYAEKYDKNIEKRSEIFEISLKSWKDIGIIE